MPQPDNPTLAAARRVIIAALALIVLQQAALNIAALGLQDDVTYIERFYLGYDYTHFHRASTYVLQGLSPYDAYHKYVAPSPSSLLNMPFALAGVRLEDAAVWRFAMAWLMLGGGLWLMARRMGSGVLLPLLALVLLLFYPAYFLAERGNADSWMFLCLALVAWWWGRPWASGVALAVSVGIKLYTLPLLAVLAWLGRWRTLTWAAGGLAVLVAAMWPLWVEYLDVAVHRTGGFATIENTSVFYPFWWLGQAADALWQTEDRLTWLGRQWLTSELLRLLAGGAFYLATLGLSLWGDLRARLRGRAPRGPAAAMAVLAYIPFVIAVPMTSFHYSLVHLLLLLAGLPALMTLGPGPSSRWHWLLAVAVALAGVQAVAWTELAGHTWPHVLPAVGLLAAMVYVTGLKVAGPRPERVESVEV